MIKGIIFDYDGVIVDSFPGVHEVYKIICHKLGVVCPRSFEDFRRQYGYNYKELSKNLGIRDEDANMVEEIFAEEIVKMKPPLYEGIREVVEQLHKKYHLFLITSNLREEALQKLRKYDLEKYFSHVGGVDETGGKYKKSEEIKYVFERESLKPTEVIYIGDRNIDYDVAKKVGIEKIILVDYGWGFDRGYAPDIQSVAVKRPQQIIEAVKSFK